MGVLWAGKYGKGKEWETFAMHEEWKIKWCFVCFYFAETMRVNSRVYIYSTLVMFTVVRAVVGYIKIKKPFDVIIRGKKKILCFSFHLEL